MAGYGFSMPERIKEILDLAKQTQPSMSQLTTPQQPQEQAGGKEIVDREIERAIRPAPNQYELGNLQSILAAKEAYATADALNQNPAAYAKANGLSEDATRALAGAQMQNAQALAEMSRNKLNAGGFNTDGYGAGDTLENVRNQLLSREAKDIAEAFQGAYSKTTDQYYNQQYEDAIIRGYSPRKASRIAGNLAREYQANRVAYLDGVYNSYGHDGRVTNPIGYQILGMIAQDNPTLGNLYANVYPSQRDAYNTETEMGKIALQSDNTLKMLNEELKNTLTRMDYAGAINQGQREIEHAYDIENSRLAQTIYQENQIFANDLAYKNVIRNRDFANDEAARQYVIKSQQAAQTANLFGYQVGSKEYATLYAAFMGYTVPKIGEQDKSFVENGVKVWEGLQKRVDTLTDLVSDPALSPELKSQYKNEIARYTEMLKAIEEKFGTQWGLPTSRDLPPYSPDNPQGTKTVIAYIIQNAGTGATKQDILADAYNWARETDKNVKMEDLEKIYDELTGTVQSQNKPSEKTAMTNAERAEYWREKDRQLNPARYLGGGN